MLGSELYQPDVDSHRCHAQGNICQDQRHSVQVCSLLDGVGMDAQLQWKIRESIKVVDHLW